MAKLGYCMQILNSAEARILHFNYSGEARLVDFCMSEAKQRIVLEWIILSSKNPVISLEKRSIVLVDHTTSHFCSPIRIKIM